MADPGNPRNPVSAALLTCVLGVGAIVALLTIAVASAIATIFGLGWGVVIVAAVVLGSGVMLLRVANPAWIVLPVAALVLPAAGMIGVHAHLARQIGDVSVTPSDQGAIPSRGYRTGIGNFLVDLRHYRFAPGTTTPVRIEAGLGRTVVALPHSRCVAVRVNYDIHASVLHALSRGLGFDTDDSSAITLFGGPVGGGSGELAHAVGAGRPTVEIDFRSQGGALYVRDYPDAIDPREDSGWPGPVYDVGPRPKVTATHGRRARLQREALRSWQTSRTAERRTARRQPGPCGRASQR